MKIKNCLAILLLVMVSQALLATEFTVFNYNTNPIEYNPVWGGKLQGVRSLAAGTGSKTSGSFGISPTSYRDSSSIHTLRGIWFRLSQMKDTLYFADLNNVLGQGRPISVIQLGVKIGFSFNRNLRNELNPLLQVECGGKTYTPTIGTYSAQQNPGIFPN